MDHLNLLIARETPQEHAQRLGQVASTYFACTYAVLVYDLLLTFGREYRQIWKAAWSPTKVLFLINRYWTIAALAGSLSLTQGKVSKSFCAKINRYEPGVGIPMFMTAAMIMTLRAWSISNKAKWVLFTLCGAMAIEFGLMAAATTRFVALPFPMDPAPCIATGPTGGRDFTLAYWIAPMFFDLMATPITFIVAYRLHQNGLRSNLFYVFLRDQGIYFLGSLGVNALNVGFYLSPDPALQAQNSSAALVFTSLLAQHLVLNLREEGASGNSSGRSGNARSGGISHIATFGGTYGGSKLEQTSVNLPLNRRMSNSVNGLHSQSEPGEQYPGIDIQVDKKTFVSYEA